MDARMPIESAAITSGSVRPSVSRSYMHGAENANAILKTTSLTGKPRARTGAVPNRGHRSTATAVRGLQDITNLPQQGASTKGKPQARYSSRELSSSTTTSNAGPANFAPDPRFGPQSETTTVNSLTTQVPEVESPPEMIVDSEGTNNVGDPQRATEYASQIMEVLFQEESASMVHPSYMDAQTDINGKMRAILVDWLIEVHMKYRLRPETLYLTVQLLDRYLARTQVPRRRLQLVGVTALFIASKYEEIDPPQAKDLVYITDNTYTKDEIFGMECSMLAALGFEIVVPTAAHFIQVLQKVNDCDASHTQLSNYFIELSLVDLRMIRYPPSQLVSASLLLSNHLLQRPVIWPAEMAQQSRYAEQTLRTCAEEIHSLLVAAPSASLQAVRKKYSLPQYGSVARMSILPAQ
jgi:hypothetical protein